jgi:hypothetical protein
VADGFQLHKNNPYDEVIIGSGIQLPCQKSVSVEEYLIKKWLIRLRHKEKTIPTVLVIFRVTLYFPVTSFVALE